MGKKKLKQERDYAIRLYNLGSLDEEDLVEFCEQLTKQEAKQKKKKKREFENDR